jgi:hypothetical protein
MQTRTSGRSGAKQISAWNASIDDLGHLINLTNSIIFEGNEVESRIQAPILA